TWKSRSLPGLPRTDASSRFQDKSRRGSPRRLFVCCRCRRKLRAEWFCRLRPGRRCQMRHSRVRLSDTRTAPRRPRGQGHSPKRTTMSADPVAELLADPRFKGKPITWGVTSESYDAIRRAWLTHVHAEEVLFKPFTEEQFQTQMKIML